MSGSIRRRVAALAAACVLLAPVGVASAEPDDGLSDLETRFATTGRWFVELESEPTSTGGSSVRIKEQQDEFVRDAGRKSIRIKVSRSYKRLFNGLSVTSDAKGAAELAELPGVVAVYPVVPVTLPEPQAVSPQSQAALAMTGVDVVQSQLGLDGTGVRVGIIDSGVDYDHRDLGGSGVNGGAFPTARVTHGWDFVGDAYNPDPTAVNYSPTARPDGRPDDCQGHGTHVAGIVGARGTVTGVAPGVTFGSYRVFGCSGSTDTEVILAAMERALADGMDVVNLSLGTPFMSWPQYPTGAAADRLVDAGVVVVSSAGNEGTYRTQSISSPASGSKVIAVASYNQPLAEGKGPLVSDFSSWGLAADLTLKPDLGAPGAAIRSTYPLERGTPTLGYQTLSGTSMASPHVAGAVALMLQADPGLRPDGALSRLQNSATPSDFGPDATLGLDAAHHQGAGLVHVDRAILGTTSVSPGKISAGESADGPKSQVLTIRNSGATPVTYTVGARDAVASYVDPAVSTATQNIAQFTRSGAGVAFSVPNVTVPAGGTAQLTVTITARAGLVEGAQYGGFVTVQPSDGSSTISVPFAGLAGDHGNLEVFPALGKSLPALAIVENCRDWQDHQCLDLDATASYAPAGHVFALGGDYPTVALQLAVPVRKLEVLVLAADSAGRPIASSAKPAYTVDHIGRDPGLSLWAWDGRLPNASGVVAEVPPGSYVLRLIAHEADGDGGRQIWTSPAFGVRRSVAPPSPSPTPPPPAADPYSATGSYFINGRYWKTECLPYSQTTRCRTDILATKVTEVNGVFVARNEFVFNNLTYLASPRSLWVGNPLGNTQQWRASDARLWRTECDTPATGRNGCRSFTWSRVVEAVPGGGYRWADKWMFNNIVRFR